MLEGFRLDGRDGFTLNGVAEGDFSGAVAGAGDINWDGINDVLIGAPCASPNGNSCARQSYAVFGRSKGSPFRRAGAIDVGRAYWVCPERHCRELLQWCRRIGGGRCKRGRHRRFPDGAPWVVANGSRFAGQTYVVFGQPGLPDNAPPSCSVTGSGTNALGQRFTEISCQDVQNGLASVHMTKFSNYTVKIPSFSVGTTSPVVVTATKIDNALTAWVTLQLRDVTGNVGLYDPVELEVERATGKPQSQTVTGIPESESRITIYNHDPGLTDLLIKVNGAKFMVEGLRDNQVRNVNVSGAMKDGDSNTMTFQARGRPGGNATILIHERSAKHQVGARHGGGG